MSEPESHHHGKNEIIIVKRHGGHHGGHHGGAWKIAYADFMTAMMAFFLVMWLVNAANEKTKASIASYFNPVQLTDEKPSEKGVKKQAKDAKGEQDQDKSKVDGDQTKTGGSAKTGEDATATSGEETKYSDADFFENPYSVLSEIAKDTGQQANISAKGEGGAQQSGPATGADGGEAYRDPFDPDFWTKQMQVENASGSSGQLAGDTTGKEQAGQEQLAKADADKPADGKDAAGAKALTAEEQKAVELKQAIDKALGGGLAGKLAEGLIVTPTEGGLLVSISEQSEAPMFTLGSAVPERDMVVAMEKIGKILAERPGAVAIRGHTDARPFKSGTYDNWRLSSARAESAYYMLVRGGLDEKRVSQISGFADRRPQVPDDPLSPANRRIEILLQDTQDKT
ncbi:chemotaxis protein MotB [Rhizobium sp. RU20A]|uniref:flagellar motor protein MotB n=1 Tax=Rhizobium sp. RU20A TaxID=1907412 RepID=UPI00095431DD|nr:flagellar motor protein MotB [Rhizobium sp. RU20A]SIQ55636.1 chemotaxis protein MotB [Rhizobium sp. RU20A]